MQQTRLEFVMISYTKYVFIVVTNMAGNCSGVFLKYSVVSSLLLLKSSLELWSLARQPSLLQPHHLSILKSGQKHVML